MIGAFSLPAHAGPADAAAAQSLFDDARRLMKAGRHATACPKLAESQRLDPGPGTQYHLADCYEHVGRTASAWALFLEVAAAARSAGNVDRERAARERAARLEPKLARLTIIVPAASRADGMRVTRNGTLVGEGLWDSAVAVDPGEQKVSATAPGHTPWVGTVAARPGGTATLSIPALARAPEQTPATSTAVPASRATAGPPGDHGVANPTSEEARNTATLGYVSTGVGIVAAGIGTYFGLRAFSKWDERNAHCNGDVCDGVAVERGDEATTAATVSTVAFGAGAIALGLGIYWIAADSGGTQSNAAATAAPRRIGLTPLLGTRSGGMSVAGNW